MNISIYQVILGYLFYYINPSYLIFAILHIFKYKYYIIQSDKEKINSIIKKLIPFINTTHTKYSNGKDLPTSYFWCYKYCGYIENFNHTEWDKIYIITTPNNYKELIEENEILFENQIIEPLKEQPKKIVVYMRKGGYKNIYYNSIKLDISHIQPMGDQINILSSMIENYKQYGQCNFFIHGVTYAGKSTLGYLLAKSLGGIYCHSFNPSEPGDQLFSLITDIERNDEPIIIVLEEADIIIQAIHYEKIKKHPEMPIMVYNKTTWCSFLDDMIFYKKVIIILTSNTDKSKIDSLDSSYLRKGRIHESYSMLKPLQIN